MGVRRGGLAARGTAGVPGGGRRRGPAAPGDEGRISCRTAGPAGLPPGTGSIRASTRRAVSSPPAPPADGPGSCLRAAAAAAEPGLTRGREEGVDRRRRRPSRRWPAIAQHDSRRMSMTAVPSGSGSSPGWEIPDDGVGNEDVDVLSLAGQPVPAGGAWLWVTAAEAEAGRRVHRLVPAEAAPGGLRRRRAGARQPRRRAGRRGRAAGVQVWAVVAGSLVRVAAWDPAGPDLWPEIVRETVIFAMGALTRTGGARCRRRRPPGGRRDRGGRVGADRVPVAAHPGEPGRVAPGSGHEGGRRRRPPFRRAGAGLAGGGAARTRPRRYRPAAGRQRRHAPARGAVARTGPVHAAARVPPASGAGTAAVSISSRSARARLLRDDAVADDLQLAGAGDAGHPGDQARDAHHPLGELGRQPGPAAGARARRAAARGSPRTPLPAADRRLVLAHAAVLGPAAAPA